MWNPKGENTELIDTEKKKGGFQRLGGGGLEIGRG